MKSLFKKTIFIILIVTSFFWFFGAKTDIKALNEYKIIISDPSPLAIEVEYRFQFTTSIALSQNERIRIVFPDDYLNLSLSPEDVICPQEMNPQALERVASCVVKEGEVYLPKETEIIVNNVVNPEKIESGGVADFYVLNIQTDAGETAYITIAIIEALRVRGEVEPFLNFEVAGVGTGESIHNDFTTASTTPISVFFGDMPVNNPILVAQDIFVRTNASYGFTVNVFQDNEPQAQIGGRTHKIYCFINGNCIDHASTLFWRSPDGILGAPETYGHFGITSEDNSLGSQCDQNYYGFGGEGRWAGLGTGSEIEAMRSCGPSDGEAQHQGSTRVGFKAEITVLQPAGDYEATFTYVITPIF